METGFAGSYLGLSHATADFRPAAARHAAAGYDQATSPVTLRTRTQVAALFHGWDLIEPGLVQVPLWQPEGRPPRQRELGKVASDKPNSPPMASMTSECSRSRAS